MLGSNREGGIAAYNDQIMEVLKELLISGVEKYRRWEGVKEQ